jgi:hypothetical protein
MEEQVSLALSACYGKLAMLCTRETGVIAFKLGLLLFSLTVISVVIIYLFFVRGVITGLRRYVNDIDTECKVEIPQTGQNDLLFGEYDKWLHERAHKIIDPVAYRRCMTAWFERNSGPEGPGREQKPIMGACPYSRWEYDDFDNYLNRHYQDYNTLSRFVSEQHQFGRRTDNLLIDVQMKVSVHWQYGRSRRGIFGGKKNRGPEMYSRRHTWVVKTRKMRISPLLVDQITMATPKGVPDLSSMMQKAGSLVAAGDYELEWVRNSALFAHDKRVLLIFIGSCLRGSTNGASPTLDSFWLPFVNTSHGQCVGEWITEPESGVIEQRIVGKMESEVRARLTSWSSWQGSTGRLSPRFI